MAVQVFCPAAAAVGGALALGDQARVQVKDEQRDEVRSLMVPEEMAGHAVLAGAGQAQQSVLQAPFRSLVI
jgi:hypothetical protein